MHPLRTASSLLAAFLFAAAPVVGTLGANAAEMGAAADAMTTVWHDLLCS